MERPTPAFDVNRSMPHVDDELSSSPAEAFVGARQIAATSYPESGLDPPAVANATESRSSRGDFPPAYRAAEAALDAAAHRYGLDERDEAAINNPFINARKHARASFRGTALATIYPDESRRNKAPVQCMVLTRDLSCSGIGIAHSEQLYPKQIIVLEAVGKLLVGEVRWCRRVDENFYVAGCRLVKTTG
jgi:hypothetical protein